MVAGRAPTSPRWFAVVRNFPTDLRIEGRAVARHLLIQLLQQVEARLVVGSPSAQSGGGGCNVTGHAELSRQSMHLSSDARSPTSAFIALHLSPKRRASVSTSYRIGETARLHARRTHVAPQRHRVVFAARAAACSSRWRRRTRSAHPLPPKRWSTTAPPAGLPATPANAGSAAAQKAAEGEHIDRDAHRRADSSSNLRPAARTLTCVVNADRKSRDGHSNGRSSSPLAIMSAEEVPQSPAAAVPQRTERGRSSDAGHRR